MSGLVLWTFFGLLEVYLLLAATLGVRAFHKGHTALAIVGAALPILWVVGALLPAKPNSNFQRRHAARRHVRAPQADKLVEARLQSSKWDSDGPTDLGPSGALWPAAKTRAAPWPNDRPATLPTGQGAPSAAAPPAGNQRVQQQLEFLRWLVETGHLTP